MRKDNLIKFCHTFRYGLFLWFVFQHLPEPNRARLLVVSVVAPRFLLSLLSNNLCNPVYQTPSKTYRSQVPAAFGIPGHVITKHLSDTPLGHRKHTYSCYHRCHSNFFSAVCMLWAPGENSKIRKFFTYHITYINLSKKK